MISDVYQRKNTFYFNLFSLSVALIYIHNYNMYISCMLTEHFVFICFGTLFCNLKWMFYDKSQLVYEICGEKHLYSIKLF